MKIIKILDDLKKKGKKPFKEKVKKGNRAKFDRVLSKVFKIESLEYDKNESENEKQK